MKKNENDNLVAHFHSLCEEKKLKNEIAKQQKRLWLRTKIHEIIGMPEKAPSRKSLIGYTRHLSTSGKACCIASSMQQKQEAIGGNTMKPWKMPRNFTHSSNRNKRKETRQCKR